MSEVKGETPVQFVLREDFQRAMDAVMEELRVSREMASEWQAKAEHLQEVERLAFLSRREEDKAQRAKELAEHQRLSIMATLAGGYLADMNTSIAGTKKAVPRLRELADAILDASR